jgi:hypothetical protein
LTSPEDQLDFNAIYSVWEYFDRPRSGVVHWRGNPYYFEEQFDDIADDYSGEFKLFPLVPAFMERVTRKEEIWRDWRDRFDRGEARHETHPGHGGIDAEYDALWTWLKGERGKIEELPTLFNAKFRVCRGDEGKIGANRQFDVAFFPISP